MKKVFKWLDFLRECEPKTLFAVICIIGTIIGAVYTTQASITKWIYNAEQAITDGKNAIEQGKKRDLIVAEHETRICVLETTYQSIDQKLNILIARTK